MNIQVKARGRPKDQSKKAALLATARKLFLEKGVDVTTDEICLQAKIAKATLYTHFKDKESLLEAVILNESALIFTKQDLEDTKKKTVVESLEEFGIRYLTFVNRKELRDWDRLIASTSHIYTNMPARFFNAGPGRGQKFLVAIIQDYIERNELKECNPQIAADDLSGLWLGFTHVEIRLGTKPPLTTKEIKAKVLHGINIFMQSYKQ